MMKHLAIFIEIAVALVSFSAAGPVKELKKRQYFQEDCSPEVTLVGDGNPHQNYFHQQLSENIDCSGDAQPCSVGESDSQSFTVGWSITTGPDDLEGWISGGFDVSETWTTGNTYNCGVAPGQVGCIWYKTAHTAYTVHRVAPDFCGIPSSPSVIRGPNTNNAGGGYYCVIGTCRSKGEGYWDSYQPAGGPHD
ncbi:hypothetical protein G7Y79_00010g028380 [Physcia stellaris]|nr:hypothetical protein G7Y79_00010g028380 [Physcia stellaris]